MERRSSGVHEIACHIVWCLKGRQTLPDAVQKAPDLAIRSKAAARGLEGRELQVMPDHGHLFVSAPRTERPVGILKALTGITAKLMFDAHPVLRTAFRTGHLWGPSCYVGTLGHVPQETALKHVRGQKARTVGRPKLSNSSPQ